jgi:hypothetical protein
MDLRVGWLRLVSVPIYSFSFGQLTIRKIQRIQTKKQIRANTAWKSTANRKKRGASFFETCITQIEAKPILYEYNILKIKKATAKSSPN